MTQVTADGGFELPDHLRPEEITDNQQRLLQLVYEEPGQSGTWYGEQIGMSTSYAATFNHDHPGILRVMTDEYGHKNGYEIRPDVAEALIDAGVIEPDGMAESRRKADVPQEKHERGNVTTVGSVDLTHLPGEQSIQDRPVKDSPSDDNGDRPPEREGVPGMAMIRNDIENRPLSKRERMDIELAPEDVFDIIRSADEGTAERVFEQVITNDE